MFDIIQVVVSIALIILVLMQERSGGLSGALGGASESTPYHSRRGLDKFIFRGTIVLAIIFVALALVDLVLV